MRCFGLSVCLVAMAACTSTSSTPITSTGPSTTVAPTVAVTGVTVSGPLTVFESLGATAQFKATVALSNGTSEDRTNTVTWRSDNTNVATVDARGVVTSQGEGNAVITATAGQVNGTQNITVRVSKRTPDPAPGQILPLPAYAQALIAQLAAADPGFMQSGSCPEGFKYRTNPWLNYIVDNLRKEDTRWGYNGKPTRNAADNGGQPVLAAGDEIAYHYGPGPDEGSPDVHLIDILVNHCGSSAQLTFRVFTGEEPGRWSGGGRF